MPTQIFRSGRTGRAFAKKYNSGKAVIKSISALKTIGCTPIGAARPSNGFKFGATVKRINKSKPTKRFYTSGYIARS